MNDPALPERELDRIIAGALAEDAVGNDVTTRLLIAAGLTGSGAVLSKDEGIACGLEVARRVFLKIDPGLLTQTLVKDGEAVRPGDKLMTVSGRLAGILSGERVTLNFLQRLSGIATLTSRFVEQVSGYNVSIYDTRKTTPGLRTLEKYAVRMGRGQNHRLDLADGVLIKDNHLAVLRKLGMTLPDIVSRAKLGAPPGLRVEVEVTSIKEALEAAGAGADIIMLDNMSLEDMKEAVTLIAGRALVEASGGIDLSNVRKVAMTGVNIISIGALTHSYRSLNMSLEIDPGSVKSG
ncbi:MAG: carboxylating nicotinate-nucleotide diphosphorylase [Chloroflexi bacterium]|nr:carboxylating nicotinate-nucleotide diphosphorylase [Chloroflexota bacterium]